MTNNFETTVTKSKDISMRWRNVPAPQRGEMIRQFGEELRSQKNPLLKPLPRKLEK